MANLKSLAKDTAIYGLSSIVGRFLNYLLVPLYTHYMPKASGDYGVSTNVYAYTALILVLLTFGMETTLFRFANDDRQTLEIGRKHSDTVFSTAMAVVGTLTALFLLLVFGGIGPISQALGYADHPEYLQMMAVVVAMDALQAIPFSYLRYQKRAIRFASLKLLFIAINIGLNVFYSSLSGQDDRVLRLPHQPALHGVHHPAVYPRLAEGALALRCPTDAAYAQLFVAHPCAGHSRHPQPGGRQDYLPAGIS